MDIVDDILVFEEKFIYEKIYIDVDNKLFELRYENGAYLFNFKDIEKDIFEELYFRRDRICCKFYDSDDKNEITFVDALEMLECKENKYRFIIFNNNHGKTNLHIEFTEVFKEKLINDSNEVISKLAEINVKNIFSGKRDDNFLLEFKIEDDSAEVVDLHQLLDYNEKNDLLYKVQLVYKKRGNEILYPFDINIVNGKCLYMSHIELLCKEENISGFFDLYIRVVMYKSEKRMRIKAPYIQKNMIKQDKKNIIHLNGCYEAIMYYTEDSGISFKVNKLSLGYKAKIREIKIEEKNSYISMEIDSVIGNAIEYRLIDEISFEIRKRNSTLNLVFDSYKIDNENNIKFKLNNKLIINNIMAGIWDAYINIKYNGNNMCVRVKNYGKEKNKKDTLLLPYIYEEKINKIIKPYYTLDDDLSFEVNDKVEINKVHYLKLYHNKIIIKANLKILKDIYIEDNKYKVKLYMVSPDLSKKLIESTSKIKRISGNDFQLIMESETIYNANTEEFKNKIYTNKFYVCIEDDNKCFNLNLNIDYNNIFIENIDKKIKDSNYKFIRKIMYKVMCKILPIKKGLVLFQSFGGRSYSGNPKYIYKYAKDNYKDLSYVWAVRNQFEEIDGNAKKVKIESLKYYYYLARAEYIISNLNMQDNIKKRKGAKFIQTWHGTPLKKISFDVNKKSPSYNEKFLKAFKKRVKKWDCLLAQNQYSINVFKSAFKYNGPIHEVGHALNDILVENNKQKIKEIRQKLNIDFNKKVLLFAPTWRDNSKYVLDINIEEMYKKLSKEYVILIKTHYFVNTSINSDKYKGFVYDVSKYEDIQELSLIADILITDYSSVMFDFAATRKPMIFYCHDLNYYKGKLRGFYFDFENDAPGRIVKTTRELVEAIDDIKNISKDYREKYDKFYDKFAYLEDGQSSKRACATIFNSNKKKKVYFLSFNIFGMGGTGRTVINTAELLVEKGYEVELISVFGDEKDKYFEINDSITVSLLFDKNKKLRRFDRVLKNRKSIIIDKDDEFYKDFSLLTDVKLIKKLMSIKDGVIVSTRPGFNVMLAKYFKIRRFKVIGQEHLNFDIHPENLQKQIKKYYNKLDLIMTLTDADTQGYLEEIPKAKNKIIKVPNAIPKLQVDYTCNKNNQIIAAGRLVPQKGFDLLIKAAPKIIEKHPDWSIKIFGKGRDNQYLKNLIIENNVEKNVFLMGPSKQIEKEMRESKIYALSSRYEGFGMVIIEAMKMEIPVVSFNCPEGPGEIITHNNDGILVENGNIDEFAKQINKLIEDEKLREKLVKNAKVNVRRYNSQNIVTNWIEALNRLN